MPNKERIAEMPLTDDQLFDFDHDRLAHFDLDEAKQRFREQPEAYRAQLVMARWLDGWLERMVDYSQGTTQEHPEVWQEGFEYAVREMGAHLRQGDFLPGGVLYNDEEDGRQWRS